MKKILIIEDDPSILKALVASLEEESYEISSADNGIDGYEKAIKNDSDLIVLDLMLPGKGGKEICKDLRENGILVPILILTSKQEEIDKVVMLELGADDYVTKPPALRELRARIHALLRRSQGSVKKEIEYYSFGDHKIDFKGQVAYKGEQVIKLSTKELQVLQFLIQNEGSVVSRDQLLNEVWGYDVYPDTRTVDNFILNLRKKIEDDPANPKHLITTYGAGYKFLSSDS